MPQPLSPRILPPFTDVLHTTVLPLEKTAHVETIDPGLIDSWSRDFFVPVLFTYRLAEKSDVVYSQILKRIKESLSKVLIPFFSFAGRWVAASPGSARRKLLCNDEGVPFLEAYLDADLDSIVQASTAFQPVPELHGHSFLGMDATQYRQELPPDGAPPIFVQVTRFRCGGLVLAVTFNHIHVDGHGFFNFMTAWSDLSRTNETAIKVDDNRAQLDVPSLRAICSGKADSVDTPEAAKKLGQWVLKSFEVGASTIKAVKEIAKTDREGRGYVSTGDCIVAQLWSSFEVLGSSVFGEQELPVIRVVEGRARFFDPPIPDVCANVTSYLLPPQIPTGELLEMPLVSIASRLREKLETPRREDWLGLEVLGKAMSVLGNKKLPKLVVSSWFNFAMYEMNFGFGNPYFAVGNNTRADATTFALAIIYPPNPSSVSSVATVNISSTPAVLQALERDPQFLQFFCAQ